MIATCVLCVAVLLWAEYRELRVLRILSKSGASLAFTLLGLANAHDDVGRAVFAGLLAAAIGDVLLLSHGRKAFLAGIGAFLLAHVFYGGAFLSLGVAPWAVVGALVPMTAFASGVWKWLAPHVGKLRWAVVAYIVVISLMVALSVGAVARDTAALPRLAAAVLFFVSDLTVARDRFVTKAFVNRAVGLPLYYAAQLLFVGLR